MNQLAALAHFDANVGPLSIHNMAILCYLMGQSGRRFRVNIRSRFTLTSDRDPLEEIVKVVKEEKIDLIVVSAHEEGRIEHALFGGENDAILRKMPCSIMLVKK